jgi:UPF0716 protein FxsA
VRTRRGWLAALALLVLVAVWILEVWLLIQVGHAIGAWPTVGILVLEALLGAALLRHEGRRTWRALADGLTSGVPPSGQLVDAALVLGGGLLLMLPGFATDLLGLVLLLPFTRPVARRLLTAVLTHLLNRLPGSGSPPANRGDVIEGETVDDAAPTVISGEILDRRP